MGLLSIQFYIFFLIVLTVYYLLPGKCQWMWLLAASLFYYFTNSSIQQLIVFACIIIINFIGSRFFSGTQKVPPIYLFSSMAFSMAATSSSVKVSYFVNPPWEVPTCLESTLGRSA